MNATSAIAFVFASTLVLGTAACGAPDTTGSTVSSKPASTSNSASSDDSDSNSNANVIEASAASKAAMGVSTWEVTTSGGIATIKGYDAAHALKATVVSGGDTTTNEVTASIDTNGEQAKFAAHMLDANQLEITAHTFDNDADLLADYKLAVADVQSSSQDSAASALGTQSLHPLDIDLTCASPIALIGECAGGLGGMAAGVATLPACVGVVTCIAPVTGIVGGYATMTQCLSDLNCH